MRRGAVDLEAHVGAVTLPNPVMAASGCFGTGAELLGTVAAWELGAVVTKSMSAHSWPGNAGPRMAPAPGGGMLNAVGLQNPGVEHWVEHELPALRAAGVRVVASIWGRSVAEFEKAAAALRHVTSSLVAVEVNVSCPNLEAAGEMFAHDPPRAADAVAACVAHLGGLPAWVKLSPNLPTHVEVARAVVGAGAAALVLTNTLIGLSIDIEACRPRLANVTGGLSGPPLRPVALRVVWEVHENFPHLPIVGVGGVSAAEHAVEFMMAGASAVEVGAAHFADPAAGLKVVAGLERWCRRHGVRAVSELVGVAHA